MPKPLIFLGHSIQIIEFMDTCDRVGIPITGIIDSDYYGNTDQYEDIPFIGSEATADFDRLAEDHDFFIGINPAPTVPRNQHKRRIFIDLINMHNLPCANIIDPDTRVNRRAILGKGIFVGFLGVVGAYTKIGDHCQINAMAAIAHDSTLGSNVILQRKVAISSNVIIEDNVTFGIDSRVYKSDVVIGKDAYIHPSVTVMRDIKPGEVVNLAMTNRRRIY